MANPNEMKTRKVLDMCEHGFWIVVIKNYSDLENPYWIYRKTFGSKRLLVTSLLALYQRSVDYNLPSGVGVW